MIYLRKCDDVAGCGKTYPGDMSRCPKCSTPHEFSSPAQVNPRDYAYDIETYPNAFTCHATHIATDTKWKFEISDRIDQSVEFTRFIYSLRDVKARMVGYNNVGFDYPVVHFILTNPGVSVREIYHFAMILIKGTKDEKFQRQVWDRDRVVEQLDLIMIWHYNKENKETGTEPTSLKALEIAMRMDNIEDLPFGVGLTLSSDQIDELHRYNAHDVTATTHFYVRSLTQIALREELSKKFNRNFLNHSNTKLGGDILMMECEKSGIEFYERINGRRQKRQTIRTSINLTECIFPYISFEHPEFKRVLEFLKTQTIEKTKGKFEGLELPTIDGLHYGFAKGGMHASVENEIFVSNETHQIVDVDVASFYPNLAIKNKLYAEHLGEPFCDAYLGVYNTRKTYGKGTPENGAYKEALNANYGNSNNAFSVFLDAKFTMSITINGQLLLCMLTEQMLKIPGLKMIQANTDGITYYCPREYIEHTRAICKWWEDLTCLELEEALYSRMFVANVNNYIAEYESGDIKRIGCYAHERMDINPGTREVPYGKDPSALVVPQAAEAALIHGKDIRKFIESHVDDYDFMLRAKAPRSNNIVMRWPEYDDVEMALANIVRYYVSNDGGSLVKIAPPTGQDGTWKRAPRVSDELYRQVMVELSGSIDQADAMGFTDRVVHHTPERVHDWYGGTQMSVAESWHMVIDGEKVATDSAGTPHDVRIHTKNKSKHTIREMGISVGWRVTDCSDVKNFDRSTLNYDYYVAEAEKLVKPLKEHK